MRNLTLVGLCLILAVAAARVLVTERTALRAAAGAFAGTIPVGIRAPLPLPFSGQTLALLADRCTVSLGPGTAALQSRSVADATLANCADLANRALKVKPQDPRLWILRAAVDLRRGDLGAMQQALDNARKGAPLQGWQAERRLVLMTGALSGSEILPLIWRDAVQADVDALMLNQKGAEYLSGHYLAASWLRPAIDDAIRRAGPGDSRRMTNLLAAGRAR